MIKNKLIICTFFLITNYAFSQENKSIESYLEQENALQRANAIGNQIQSALDLSRNLLAIRLANERRKSLPLVINDEATLVNSYAIGSNWINVIQVYNKNKSDNELINEYAEKEYSNQYVNAMVVCYQKDISQLLELGIHITDVYTLRSGEIIKKYTVNQSDCIPASPPDDGTPLAEELK